MGKSGGGSGSTNTVTQNSAPPPQVMAAYQQATGAAQQAAGAPYQPYPGSMVAPFSNLQTSAFGNAYAPSNIYAGIAPSVNAAYGNAGTALGSAGAAYNAEGQVLPGAGTAYSNAGAAAGNAQDVYGQAASAYGASTAPLWGNTMQYSGNNVNQYLSPYLNDVVNSTAQQFANTNAIQNAGIVGNAAAQGAWGGDRSAVAQAITAGQQQQAEAPVLAGLYNTGFTTAQGEFNTQQAAQLGANEAQGWLGSQAGAGLSGIASGEANLGTLYNQIGAGITNLGAQYGNMGAGYAGIGNQYGVLGNDITNFGATGANIGTTQEGLLSSLGQQQQGEMQAGLNVPYQQYVAEQAYPFQAAQYFANVAEGTGSLSGGQSSTTSPGPSTASQLLGLGIGGAGLLGETGAFGSSGWLTGAGGLLGAGAAADAPIVAGVGGAFATAPFTDLAPVAAAATIARGGAINPTKGAMPRPPQVGARPMDIGLRFIPHKLHMADGGGIIGYRPSEIQHFDTGGSPVSPTMPNVSIPDVSISWVPQTQGATGHGPPNAPQAAQQPQTIGSQLSAMGSALKTSGLGTSLKSAFSPSSGSTTSDVTSSDQPWGYPTAAANAFNAAGASGLYNDPGAGIVNGPQYAGGGGIRGFANGGYFGQDKYQGWTGFTADDIQPSWFGPGQPEDATTGSQDLRTRDMGTVYNLPGTRDWGSGDPTDQVWRHWAKPNSQDLASGGGIRGYDEGGGTPVAVDLPDVSVTATATTAPTVHGQGLPAPPQAIPAPDHVSNWETQHNNFAGMRVPGIAAGGPKTNPSGWQQFSTPEDGVYAISRQLDRYASGATTGQPLNTLRSMVSTWAPPSENDTNALINRATKVVGAGPDDPLDTSDPAVKAKLVEAFIRNEQGGLLPVSPSVISSVVGDPNFKPSSTGISGGASSRGTQLAQADTGTMSDASPAPMGIVGSAPSPARSQAMIENATSPASMNALHSMGVDPWLALMTAGFGMAAGNSPHALQNIGAGALAGAQSLQQQRLAGPKMALEAAEAQKAQAEARVTGAEADIFARAVNPYAGGANPSPQTVAGALDTHITNTAKDMTNGAKTAAESGTPPVAPAGGAPGQQQTAPSVAPSPSPGAVLPPGAGGPPVTAPTTAATPSLPPGITKASEVWKQQLAEYQRVADQLAARAAPYLPGGQLYDAARFNIRGMGAQATQAINAYNTAVLQLKDFATKDPAIAYQVATATAAGEAGARYQYEGGKPVSVTEQSPTGQKTQTFVTPPTPGQPPQGGAGTGQPGVVTEQPSGTLQQLKASNDEYDEAVKAAKTAQEARLPLQAVENSMVNFRTGPTAEARLNLGRAWQDVAQTLNIPVDSDLGKWIASGEIITKEGTRLGYELARTLGSREAAMIVQQAIKSNPSVFNSPQGNEKIIALLRAGLQREQDKRDFFDQWAPTHGGGFVGASHGFEQTHPAEEYINHVIPPLKPPPGLPWGSSYSPARGQWRDPDGHFFNAAGAPLGG